LPGFYLSRLCLLVMFGYTLYSDNCRNAEFGRTIHRI